MQRERVIVVAMACEDRGQGAWRGRPRAGSRLPHKTRSQTAGSLDRDEPAGGAVPTAFKLYNTCQHATYRS